MDNENLEQPKTRKIVPPVASNRAIPNKILSNKEIIKLFAEYLEPTKYGTTQTVLLPLTRALLEAQAELTANQYEKVLDELKQALQDDASDLWRITNAIKDEIRSREWIMEGRGMYAWDDDHYRDETRQAFEAVLKLIAEVQHPAQKRFHLVMNKAHQISETSRVNVEKIKQEARTEVIEWVNTHVENPYVPNPLRDFDYNTVQALCDGFNEAIAALRAALNKE